MDIYLDNKFCSFVSKALTDASLSNREEYTTALKFYDLLGCNSISIKNIPISKSDLRRMIADKSNFENLKQLDLDTTSIHNPFSVIFADDLDTKNTRKETEISAYNFSEIHSKQYLFFDKETLNVREDLQNWGRITSRLLKFKHLVICDNYLFNNKTDIVSFLQNIFSNQNKNRRYEILINTSKKGFEKDFDSKNFIKKKFDEINMMLSENILLKDYSLTLMLNDYYHDRHIYTNFQILESTNSFSLYFNCDAKLHSFSMLLINRKDIVFEKYLPDLQKLKKVFDDHRTEKFSSGKFTMFNFI